MCQNCEPDYTRVKICTIFTRNRKPQKTHCSACLPDYKFFGFKI